jgi:GxxExxY protein
MDNNKDSQVLEYWNKISYDIIGASYKVHSTLGPGLLESVYETCLDHELRKAGYNTRRQMELPIKYDSITLDAKYRIDLLVHDTIIVEIKAVEELTPLHKAQLMTYMKLSGIRLGLLINFNTTDMKKGIRRILI